jgi:protein SCO1/2
VQGDSLYHGIVSAEPTPLPDAILTDTSGQPYNLREHAEGKLTLLYLGYTNCPDICPAHMANVAAALKRLPASTATSAPTSATGLDPAMGVPQVVRGREYSRALLTRRDRRML